jgi:thioredoxin-related protein
MDFGSASMPDARNGGSVRVIRRARSDITAHAVILAYARIHFYVLLLAFALAVPCNGHAAETVDAAGFFNLNMGDLKAEVAEARKEGKKALFVMFEQEGCPYCLSMKRDVLNRKDVQDYYRANFATLSLDIHSSVPVRNFADREQTEKEFSQASRVRATPTFVFYDLAGSEIARYTGSTQTAEEFLLLGQFVASGAYKTRTFAQYKRDQPHPKGS